MCLVSIFSKNTGGLFMQCELSCDVEVVQSISSYMHLQYSETIIGVVKY